MFQEGNEGKTLDEYRQWESQLHLDLMNSCKKYIAKLGIVSIVGIIDIVKQETIELEKATRNKVHEGTFQPEEETSENIDIFSDQKLY